MADEITVATFLGVKNGSLDFDLRVNKSIDQAALGLHNFVKLITTSDAALSASELSTMGWAIFMNLDVTNYVEFGPDSGGSIVPAIKLLPGEAAILRLEPGITVRSQANTGSCESRFAVLED